MGLRGKVVKLWSRLCGTRSIHKTIDGKPVPGQLTLTFSKAADYDSINALFKPDIKEKVDPHGYVRKRYEPVFRDTVNNGQAAFLHDKKGNVMTLTMAYRLHNNPADKAAGKPHDYAELGTSLARIQGYKSAQLVIAALAIKEWWENPPQKDIVADIKHSNEPSVKVYHNALGWESVPDSPALDGFFVASYATITDKNGKPCPPPDAAERASVTMHASRAQALSMQAQILLEYMKQGQLFNKRSKHVINVDVSVLNDVGLTFRRLEAISKGQSDKKQLLQVV